MPALTDPEVLAPLLDLQVAQGTEAAIVKLRHLSDIGELRHRNMHDYMHALGMFALELYPTPADAFAHCTDETGFGCYHGVAMGYAEREGLPLSELSKICAPFASAISGGDEACAHGVGHVTFIELGNDLPAALAACETFTTGTGAYNCREGVFSQFNIAIRAGEVPPPTPVGTLAPCDTLPDESATNCYRYLASWVFRGRPQPAAREFDDLCSSPAPQHRVSCVEGLAILFNGMAERDPLRALALCRTLEPFFKDTCLLAVPQLQLSRATPELVLSVCNEIVDPATGARCVPFLRQVARRSLDARAYAALCARLDPRYLTPCR